MERLEQLRCAGGGRHEPGARCADRMPEGYGSLLRYVASHGYIIVAANQRYVGDGTAQRKALDFMLAENAKEGSKYYQKIDVDKIGALGHSPGSSGTEARPPRLRQILGAGGCATSAFSRAQCL